MATGDTANMLARLKAVMPAGWFPDTSYGQPTNSPVLDGVLTGVASCWSFVFSLLQYAINQTRMATASGVWLDIIAGDFFGSFIKRRTQELDPAFLTRIKKELFRPKGTRKGLYQALLDLTGNAPRIFEPQHTHDTGGYTTGGVGYGVGGGYGSMELPFQFFVTVYPPTGGGIAIVAGYGNIALGNTGMPGGYGVGAIEYADMSMINAPVLTQDILNVINDVRPAATIAWTNITYSGGTNGGTWDQSEWDEAVWN